MTANEAIEFTLNQINEMVEKYDISLNIRNYKFKDDNHKTNLIEKYSDSKRAHYSLWKNITFNNLDETQTNAIFELGNYLNLCGISFDSGGFSNSRDWELDWSFKYVGKDDQDAREARNQLEDMINSSS